MSEQNRPLVRLAVRRHLRAELGRRRVSRRDVDAALAHVSDDVIDHAAAEAGVSAPAAGGFLQWLKDHGPQIAKIVALILAALGL